jgi:GNAT superfamily N-acetyltransferase
MADTKIDILGVNDLPLVADLYNQVYKPAKDIGFFQRRLRSRENSLILLAVVDGRPVGFFVGMELKPTVFFEWLYGVLADYRRQGVCSQLIEASNAWAAGHGYTSSRLECHNQHRPMLHMAIKHRYDILGIRWDPDHHENLVIFEKELAVD